MKIAEAKLLLEFARLMLRISHAQNPLCAIDVTDKTVTRTPGFKALRAFFLSLSPKKRAKFARHLREQIDGYRALEAKCKAAGEPFNIGEVVLELSDAESGKPIRAEDAIVFEPAEDEPQTPVQEIEET